MNDQARKPYLVKVEVRVWAGQQADAEGRVLDTLRALFGDAVKITHSEETTGPVV